MRKIINYLFYISKNIDSIEIESEKESLIKILQYLKDYKMENPINFLKKSNLGIMIKYLGTKLGDKELLDNINSVYKNFEDQVLDQLFMKK